MRLQSDPSAVPSGDAGAQGSVPSASARRMAQHGQQHYVRPLPGHRSPARDGMTYVSPRISFPSDPMRYEVRRWVRMNSASISWVMGFAGGT